MELEPLDCSVVLRLLNYEWKPPGSCRVYIKPQSVSSGSFFVQSDLLYPAHIRSFVSFPTI